MRRLLECIRKPNQLILAVRCAHETQPERHSRSFVMQWRRWVRCRFSGVGMETEGNYVMFFTE